MGLTNPVTFKLTQLGNKNKNNNTQLVVVSNLVVT